MTPAPAEILEYTGERMVPEKADHHTFWEHIYRYRFATGYASNRRVLDIACGEGYGTRALQEAGAASVVGVDISEASCAHARRRYGVDARPGNAEQTPFADRSFELVVSFETIEHLARPAAFLGECLRLLVPGGLLIISTPNRCVYSANQRNPFHCSEMDEEEFVAILKARFAQVEVHVQGGLATAAWWRPRSWAATQSPWNRVRGVWRLKSMLCPHIDEEGRAGDRPGPVEAILRRERTVCSWVNPFAVRRRVRWGAERPRYLIAVARKAEGA